MAQRLNLPYSTQDLLPQVSNHQGSMRISGAGSMAETSHTSVGSTSLYNHSNITHSNNKRLQTINLMFKRLLRPTTLDFETAIWEIFHLIVNPKKMYRSHYYYKQQQAGKSSYARDDPSFLILLTAFLSISAIAWGLAYSPHVLDILKLIIYMVFIDFYLTGIVIATISWLLTNKLFNNTFGSLSRMNSYSINYIEWGFCFDIHCNSFLIIWCLLYLVQFLLLPILTNKKSFLSLALGNSLYFGSIGYYFVITFYGFNSLPIINNSSLYNVKGLQGSNFSNPAKVLQMIIIAVVLPILVIGWILSICFGFNVAYTMVDTYFN